MKKMTEEEYSFLTQHLTDLGCPLQLGGGYGDTPAGLKFEQHPDPANNMVFDLDDGGTGYVMDIRIFGELNLPIRIRRVSVKAPWGLQDLSLLPEPSTLARTYEYYEFPRTTLGFHRSVVANDFLSGKRTLDPGGEVEGLLLAVDKRPIPNDYPEHGRTVVELSIFDQRGNRYASEFRLRVDRSFVCDRDRVGKIVEPSKSVRRRRRFIAAA